MTDAYPAAKYPPLPEPVRRDTRQPSSKSLPTDGCYFIAYGRGDAWYQGTMRVHSESGQLRASGDLYAVDAGASNGQEIGAISPRSTGIPIFPIADYTYYLRVIKIEAAEQGFKVVIDAYRYIASEIRLLNGGLADRWVLERRLTATMAPANAPPGYPKPDQFFAGDVDIEPDFPPRLQMGWVSASLRRAVIEMDCTADTHIPMDNGAGVTWPSAFASFGWDLTPIRSNTDVTKTSPDPVWIGDDAFAAMREHRDSNDLDSEWRYYVLLVPKLFSPQEADGFMFHERREALGISAHATFPDQPQFGADRGKQLDMTNEFFRVIIHELGHAMGLEHNDTGFHFMRPTPEIAQDASVDKPFPTNIEWSFDPVDADRLRHWPDIVVRPGGAEFGVGKRLETAEAG